MFKMFKLFNRFVPFKTFKQFNRCAPFKSLKNELVPNVPVPSSDFTERPATPSCRIEGYALCATQDERKTLTASPAQC
jgi:hypothetical protein